MIVIMLREVTKFLISGESVLWKGRSVHSSSIFPFWNSNFQRFKIFSCGALTINIHIFRFKMDAGLHIDIDFNTESKCFCSRSSFFQPSVGPQNQPNPWNWFLLYAFGGLRVINLYIKRHFITIFIKKTLLFSTFLCENVLSSSAHRNIYYKVRYRYFKSLHYVWFIQFNSCNSNTVWVWKFVQIRWFFELQDLWLYQRNLREKQ